MNEKDNFDSQAGVCVGFFTVMVIRHTKSNDTKFPPSILFLVRLLVFPSCLALFFWQIAVLLLFRKHTSHSRVGGKWQTFQFSDKKSSQQLSWSHLISHFTVCSFRRCSAYCTVWRPRSRTHDGEMCQIFHIFLLAAEVRVFLFFFLVVGTFHSLSSVHLHVRVELMSSREWKNEKEKKINDKFATR